MKTALRRLLRYAWSRVSPRRATHDATTYWNERARAHGARAVFNLAHSDAELDGVTQLQKREILPWLTRSLSGDEEMALDLGCGPGRFTADLAELSGGRAVGVDPIAHFLTLAPPAKGVEYKIMEAGRIPVSDHSVDLVFCCLVLGGICGDVLTRTVGEIERVLKKNGLLFLVENTTSQPNSAYWYFRPIQEHARLFPFVALSHLHDYWDLGERISIMAGRCR